MAYVELHCHSYFSFLEGAASPEQLVDRAVELGYEALAITDLDGFHGIPRAHLRAKEQGLHLIVGSELRVIDDLAPLLSTHPDRRVTQRVIALVENQQGYQNLCALISQGRLRCTKGGSWLYWHELEQRSQGLIILSAGEHGPIDAAWRRRDLQAALLWAKRIRDAFPGSSYLQLQHHFAPGDDLRIRDLEQLAHNVQLPTIVAQGVFFAHYEQRKLFDVQTCIKEKTTLKQAGRKLLLNAERYLKAPQEIRNMFRHHQAACDQTLEVSRRAHYSMDELAYIFPKCDLPPGESDYSYLKHLVEKGARRRYPVMTGKVRRQLQHELALVKKLDMSGYFLIVWDIVQFCRRRHILCQGRGSAANSAICYSLEITAVDPVGMELLFERFLSEERKEMPDIDIDIASDRREEVIQYVYQRFGKERVAMACNVISYHARSAMRDIGKIFGLSVDQVDRLAKSMDHHALDLSPQGVPTNHSYRGASPTLRGQAGQHIQRSSGLDLRNPLVQQIFVIAQEFEEMPRHLGIHSGGMVITAGPMNTVVPVENATKQQRTVTQWDKDDLNAMGLIKIDLLGLGMLSAIDKCIELIDTKQNTKIDLARLPADDPAVYDMICDADTIGVFQIESRAQMNMLPRLKPRNFYDLVVEVAIIRPGPIQGNMIHPYLRRRDGVEPIEYAHPSLKPILERTLGVPLFQEQGMRLAVATAGFTPGEADELRRAMGHKRSRKRMEALRLRLLQGMENNDIDRELSERIFNQLCAFADYGFPESHSASFALIVYASCYLKYYYPAAFCAGLINAQPMGFYSVNTLIADAQRHGVKVLPPCVVHSHWESTLTNDEPPALLLGIKEIKGLKDKHQKHYEQTRSRPFGSVPDFVLRTGLPLNLVAKLASAGAFRHFYPNRRDALWQVAAIPANFGQAPLLDRIYVAQHENEIELGQMSSAQELSADYHSLGYSVDHHPLALIRPHLPQNTLSATQFNSRSRDGQRAILSGMVITRQRPGSAKGMMFITLEDETGIANLVLVPSIVDRYRQLARRALLLTATGLVERQGNVVNLKVESLAPIDTQELSNTEPPTQRSRDFR